MKRILFFLFIALCVPGFSFGQDGKEEFAKFMQTVIAGFNNNEEPLSFNIKFSFAYENSKDNIVDSLTGEFKIYQGKYWSNIDNTINIVNENYSISIFPEDELIYLRKLDSQTNISFYNFFQNSDLLSNHYGSISVNMKTENDVDIYSFEISENPDIKWVQCMVDNKTGRLMKIIQLINSMYLMDSHNSNPSEHQFAIITAEYFNYSTKTFDKGIFDSDNYILLSGEEFKPSSAYKDYYVFKAN